MSKRRPIYKKAIDVFTLAIVGLFVASWAFNGVDGRSPLGIVVGLAFALAGLCWFSSLFLAVRYLWTGRETRLRDLFRRRARPASPSPG